MHAFVFYCGVVGVVATLVSLSITALVVAEHANPWAIQDEEFYDKCVRRIPEDIVHLAINFLLIWMGS